MNQPSIIWILLKFRQKMILKKFKNNVYCTKIKEESFFLFGLRKKKERKKEESFNSLELADKIRVHYLWVIRSDTLVRLYQQSWLHEAWVLHCSVHVMQSIAPIIVVKFANWRPNMDNLRLLTPKSSTKGILINVPFAHSCKCY